MMIPTQFPSGAPPPLSQMLPPIPSVASSFWQAGHVHDHLRKLQDTVDLLKAVQEELDALLLIKGYDGFIEEEDDTSPSCSLENTLVSSGDVLQSSRKDHALLRRFFKVIKAKRMDVNVQESLSLEAVNSLLSTLTSQLAPFNFITSQTSSWEERSLAIKLGNKLQKSKRNKHWKKRKRKRVAELLQKERERYDQVDQAADEWRAREIAKDIAKRKVEKMKEIAKLKAKEERQRLESELELLLMVEKLQELRSIRIQKMKKQGHFLPEEDDKFLERVRAAVEEEERQAAAAADTDAAKDAIATAEETRKTIQNSGADVKDPCGDKAGAKMSQDQLTQMENQIGSSAAARLDSGWRGSEVQSSGGGYDSVANLPVEFYHYYHGSNTDMGTLIEVRRMWDAYIRPGGSWIPGHWVQPPPPANEVWASYLVGRK
ncbi:U11/U12 small nuclear ribonucleoprotein 59 kDa protein isoform X2 [Magnolia sinica]|nr:U11/U12 small nuclear ribonucleoprotein 59 kDa protein isoform X2 [Magnolia sinica]